MKTAAESKTGDEARLGRLRRLAAEKGYAIRKDRVRRPNIDHRGGYMLIDADGSSVIAGSRFDLSLRGLEDLLTSNRRRIRPWMTW